MTRELVQFFLAARMLWGVLGPFLVLCQTGYSIDQVFVVVAETGKSPKDQWKTLEMVWRLQTARGWVKILLVCLCSGGLVLVFKGLGRRHFLLLMELEFFSDKDARQIDFKKRLTDAMVGFLCHGKWGSIHVFIDALLLIDPFIQYLLGHKTSKRLMVGR